MRMGWDGTKRMWLWACYRCLLYDNRSREMVQDFYLSDAYGQKCSEGSFFLQVGKSLFECDLR